MFNNWKLILLFLCIFGFIKAESKLSGKSKFKRGVVVGDDQYVIGHIDSARNEDIFIGKKSSQQYPQNPQYANPQYVRPPPGYGAGVGAGVGAGNRLLYKRATTVIRSPNGVYIGQGNTFGDSPVPSNTGRPANYAGARAGSGAGINAGRQANTGYVQPNSGTSYGAGYNDNKHGQFSTSSGYTVKPASGYNDGINIGNRNTFDGSIKAH